jgi:predicted outer membrane repeat protein
MRFGASLRVLLGFVLVSRTFAANVHRVYVAAGENWTAAAQGAPPSALVVLASGTHRGCAPGGIELSHNVTLLGEGGSNGTVVDCQGAGRHLVVRGGKRANVFRLTLTRGVGGGLGSVGGCILAEGTAAEVHVQDSVLVNCGALHGGAVALYRGARLMATRSVFANNSAAGKGGALLANSSSVVLDNVDLDGNRADLSGGGAAFESNSSAMISACRVRRNAAGAEGGGVAAVDSSLIHVEKGTEIEENTAGGDGGGLYATDSSTLRCVDGVTIAANRCEGRGGGCAVMSGSSFTAQRDIKVAGNMATVSGGGVRAHNSDVFLSDTVEVRTHASSFIAS